MVDNNGYWWLTLIDDDLMVDDKQWLMIVDRIEVNIQILDI